MLIVHVAFFVVLFGLVAGQSSNCEAKETCEDCIREIECAWCIDPKSVNANGERIHCFQKNDTFNSCDQTMTVSPQTYRQTISDRPYSNDISNAVQIKPQRVKLALRKGETYKLNFTYKIAENYPVDLYYIMDLSASMASYQRKLGELGIKLAKTMKNITTNFKLGFGSFIDKVDLPFVSTVPSKLESPCTVRINGKNVRCVSPYSFKNHMPLTSKYEDFVSQVTSAQVSGNLDAPEGGLDAIMQAIVCKDKIKWREQARHLLVFSTDAEFHIAGDGKLAGVIEPNNGKCHPSDDYFLKYDYPSVSQINYVAKQNKINIIFAIVNKYDIKTSYSELSKNIENSNFGILDEKDDENVVNLVVDNYKKIVKSVKFTSNASSEVDVKFSSTCKSTLSDRCTDVHVGDVLEFTATIQPRNCPQDGRKTKLISISPEALSEHLLIELDILCDCPCSLTNHTTFVSNSNDCNQFGDLKCGVCDCHPGRFGKNCQCDSTLSSSDNTTDCIMEGTTDICSNLGECKCGQCECYPKQKKDEIVSGKFCQCDNYSCKKANGLICSGKGKCNCKICECLAGFSGEACECEESTANCIAPGSNTICSDHGECKCGQCQCKDVGYSGTHCEDCVSCPAQRCEELRHCVECQAYKTGIHDQEQCKNVCTTFTTIIVDKFENESEEDVIKRCKVPNKDGCIINFQYYYDDTDNKKLTVTALKHPVCPEPPNVFAWIMGVIGSILLAGLLMLLIWKICTSVHDRREYAKFENERKALSWNRNDNPLYREATSRFANPSYNRSSSRISYKKD